MDKINGNKLKKIITIIFISFIFSLSNPWANFNIASNSQDFSLSSSNISSGSVGFYQFSNLKSGQYNLIIDCCAEPAIEISKVEADRVFNTNLVGTFNLLKKCARDKSNLIFLSSSRVYSIDLLSVQTISYPKLRMSISNIFDIGSQTIKKYVF